MNLSYWLLLLELKTKFHIYFADKYLSHIARSRAADKETDKLPTSNDNGFIWETADPGFDEQPVENGLRKRNASEVGIPDDSVHD